MGRNNFSSLCINIAADTLIRRDISSVLVVAYNMSHLANMAKRLHWITELASHIGLLAIPFAPVIITRAAGTLIAQTYISSFPASALLLISPPPSNSALAASDRSLLPTALPELDFEPRFPVAVMATEQERPTLEKDNRLWKDLDVDRLVVEDEAALTGQESLARIE